MSMCRQLSIFFWLVCFLSCPLYAQNKIDRSGFDSIKLSKAEDLLKQKVASGAIPGIVALASHDGTMAALTVAGSQQSPLKSDSIFRIASMTKPITSVAVMILVDDGKIKLDDPIAKYIPEFKKTQVQNKDGLEPLKRDITIHDLLTHTSGIMYRFMAQAPFGEKFSKAGIHDGISAFDDTLENNIKKLAGMPLAAQPGTMFLYGLNTDVLGRVVEVASGQNLAQFMESRIFKPLQMQDTYFYPPKEKCQRLAPVFTLDKDKKVVPAPEGNIVSNNLVWSATFHCTGPKKYYSGGGGLVSTVADYHRFLLMILRGGTLDGAMILKPETVKKMVTSQTGTIPGSSFGYGFGVTPGKTADAPTSYTWGGFYGTNFFVDGDKKMIYLTMTQIVPNPQPQLFNEYKKLVEESIK